MHLKISSSKIINWKDGEPSWEKRWTRWLKQAVERTLPVSLINL
ncbi:hypothetical protein UNSWDHB_1351 [Dehalobacter sp. UNSWDHB]|nr:hypothetical protein DHBDCA_p373 [Dehalobacter sp. DCA]AFV04439.1 hypothetical protein DCF50_p433 [Dehalobacter sp. CF]EQB21351.1 hypothetical protein UNSWDHB_1351 [Dehalobacter sp. UNSWDHB]